MIVGSTWNAKIKPSEDFCLPSSPNTNSEPKNAKLRSLFAPFPAYSKIVRPIAKRKTKNANASCNPSPQRTVFRRIALRFVENRYARPSMVARPSNPVNRPMRSPFSASIGYEPHAICTKSFLCDVLIFTSNAEQAILTSGDRHPSGEQDPRESGRPPGKRRIAQELRYPSAHDTTRRIA